MMTCSAAGQNKFQHMQLPFYVYGAYVFNGSRSWLQNCGTTRSQLLGAIYASNEIMHDLSAF